MNSADLEDLNAAKVIDARMDPCPGPLLDAKEVITQVNAGEVIEIQAGDPEARRDISAWATKVGHEFLGVLDTRGYDRIFVMKKTQ
jgi:tRNA 2-thiouridine synthesizing protein A